MFLWRKKIKQKNPTEFFLINFYQFFNLPSYLYGDYSFYNKIASIVKFIFLSKFICIVDTNYIKKKENFMAYLCKNFKYFIFSFYNTHFDTIKYDNLCFPLITQCIKTLYMNYQIKMITVIN